MFGNGSRLDQRSLWTDDSGTDTRRGFTDHVVDV